MNHAMRKMVISGEAINVASNFDTASGNYLLPPYLRDRIVKGSDICDLDRDAWIWLVAEPCGPGSLVAFSDPKAKVPEGYLGIWFR